MGKVFARLFDKEENIKTAEMIDWLFDDLKFEKERNWNRGYVAQLTRRFKKNLETEKCFISQDKTTKLVFPNQASRRKKKQISIIMPRSDSFSKDLIRHIRNGFAHGNTTICNVSKEPCFEIIDYSDTSKSPEKQNTYICIQIKTVLELYEIYLDINQSIMHAKPKDRKETKRLKEEK